MNGNAEEVGSRTGVKGILMRNPQIAAEIEIDENI
jgi:hypothetical protein